MNIFIIETIVFNESQKFSASKMQIKNIFICQSDQKFDNDDINKKYLDMNYIDELNILIIVLYFDK